MSDKDKGNALDKNRIIYFCGSFNEDNVSEAIEKLIEFESSNPQKDIVIFIDSYGGSYHSFISFHDAIKLCRCRVATVCIGKAMSAGQLLLMSGSPGLRFSTPFSTIMMHSVASTAWGKIAEMENEVAETRRCQDIIETLVIKYTRLDINRTKSFMAKDTYLSPTQAIELGLIDNIITEPKVLYSQINI